MTADLSASAEALTAITGIFQDEPVTPEQGRLAAKIPKEWRAAVVEFLNQKKKQRFKLPKRADHGDILETLSGGIDANRRASLVGRLTSPELGEAYLSVVARATAHLLDQWPRHYLDTPLGPRVMPPSKTEQMRAASLLAVVDDPNRILDEMRMMSLTTEQATALKTCYPALFEMLKAILFEELARKYKSPDKYALPFSKELIIRRLVGLPPGVSVSKAQPKGDQQSTPQVSIDFKSLRTKAQDLATR